MPAPTPTPGLLAEFLPPAQALEHRAPAGGVRVTLYAVLALILSAVAWASLSQIDTLVVGRGRLVTPLPNLVVSALEPGILRAIAVRIGQVVRQGEVLAHLDPTFTGADVGQLRSRSQTLALEIQRLESELAGADSEAALGTAPQLPAAAPGVSAVAPGTALPPPSLESPGILAIPGQKQLQVELLAERRAAYAARLRQFEETIRGLHASLETNTRDQQIQARRVKSLENLEAMHKALETKQMGSKANLLGVETQRLEVERDYTLAVNRRQEIERQIAATEAARDAFTKAWRQAAMEKLSTAMQSREEVNEQLAKAERRSELVTLSAPADAIVLEIGKKSVGSVVQGAETLFVLVPLDAPLEAEVEVSPSDVGEIRVGDTARIKIDAYPFQKHGVIEGRVRNVSADTFSRPTPVGGPVYYYLVRLDLTDTGLQNLPVPPRLLPGMTLGGEIRTGRRTVISYFLYPIIRVLDESMRER